MGCAVFEGSAQLMYDVALLGERKPQGGEGRARDVATEMLQTRTVPSLDLDGGVQTEAVELGAQFLEFWRDGRCWECARARRRSSPPDRSPGRRRRSARASPVGRSRLARSRRPSRRELRSTLWLASVLRGGLGTSCGLGSRVVRPQGSHARSCWYTACCSDVSGPSSRLKLSSVSVSRS